MGRIAIVTNVVRNAVDADVPVDERVRRRTAKSCGPVAPTLATSLGGAPKANAETTVANEHWFAEEITYKP
jgi:hypothetical protein